MTNIHILDDMHKELSQILLKSQKSTIGDSPQLYFFIFIGSNAGASVLGRSEYANESGRAGRQANGSERVCGAN